MTAKDARQWAAAAATAGNGAEPRQTEAYLAQWHKAIEAAAKAGRFAVAEDAVERLRMPISSAAKQAAFERLAAEGFTVAAPPGGTPTVSW